MMDRETLNAIAQLIDTKLAKQSEEIDAKLSAQMEEIDAKLEKQTEELKAYIRSNNVAIGEDQIMTLADKIQCLMERVDEIETVTAKNCYRLDVLEIRSKMKLES